MISGKILQSCIDDAYEITQIHFCLLEPDNEAPVAATYEAKELSPEVTASFAVSEASTQAIENGYLFKVRRDTQPSLILAAFGPENESYMIGQLVAKQLEALTKAYQKRYDKNHFIQSLLLGELQTADALAQAQKLHIRTETSRIVYLIETKYEKDELALETIRQLFGQSSSNFITSVDENYIVLLKEVSKKETPEQLHQTAWTLVDMLNTEAMTQARVAYGSIVSHLKDVPTAYQEAKAALEIGRSFYPERAVLSYQFLGVGRLIYELPPELCDSFLDEILNSATDDILDENTLLLVQKLFNNNLNISETARQLYIHRNTLVYQLEKIHKATGLDVRSFEDALTFRIALMIRNYRNNHKK